MPSHDNNSPGARELREAGFVRLPRHWVPREMRDEMVARAALIEGVVAEARLEVAAKGIKTSQADVLAVEMLHSFASAIRSRGEK